LVVPDPSGSWIVSVYWVVWVKVAVTNFAEFIVMVAGLEDPVRLPLQPLKVEPAAGAAVRVTTVPDA
jgi:hypothetical protein